MPLVILVFYNQKFVEKLGLKCIWKVWLNYTQKINYSLFNFGWTEDKLPHAINVCVYCNAMSFWFNKPTKNAINWIKCVCK